MKLGRDQRHVVQTGDNSGESGGTEKGDIGGEGENTPPRVPFNWHSHGLIVEFKESIKQDPFYTREEIKAMSDKVTKTMEKKDNDSRLTRGQPAHYAAELFHHQHRTHAFQIFVMGDCARFLYCDRAGIVVCERFNYVQNPKILAEFLWSYNHMSRARRGWDDSVSKATEAEFGAVSQGDPGVSQTHD